MGITQHIPRPVTKLLGVLMMTSVASSCTVNSPKVDNVSVRQMLAQKLMVDIRYFCPPAELKRYKGRVSCDLPVTALDPSLKQMITQHSLGGVILFAENFESIEQTTQLVSELQQAASLSDVASPLFISVDQEGGRVARLPRQWSTATSGNMAIGATYANHSDKFATLTGEVLGAELNSLGINVNHGPTVDVNVNPRNPVINIRSFGESATEVAQLGIAQARAMQAEGVVATLKHFPGHGDTSVDSHTGLPRVEHSFTKVKSVDLLPFQQAIDAGVAKMIMTAHIQYPELDSSTFVAKSGKTMIKPATMSREILTDLLRQQMGFNGVVVTDALDMAGVSEFFDEPQAVIETFKAGADIALMPLRIRSIEDLPRLDALLDALEVAVESGELAREELQVSYQRIQSLKTEFAMGNAFKTNAKDLQKSATKTLRSQHHQAIEADLADASITLLKGDGTLPKNVTTLHLALPDKTKCAALKSALMARSANLKVTCASSFTESADVHKRMIDAADAVLVANITPKQSAVELGGMEDLKKFKQSTSSKWQQDQLLLELLQHAKSKGKNTWFVSLRTPYEIQKYARFSDHVIATYGYNAHVERHQGQEVAVGPAYTALARLLLGEIEAKGQSPVSIKF